MPVALCNSVGSNEKEGCNPPAIFEELSFIRLSPMWQVSVRFPSYGGGAAFAGRVFKRFEMKWAEDTYLDFSYRGKEVSGYCGEMFLYMLSQPHLVSECELLSIAELLGPELGTIADGKFVHNIVLAEVGLVHGRPVLAVHWQHARTNVFGVSAFIDAEGDGAKVHEVHFSTPIDMFAVNSARFYETMRSCQWASLVPPPVCASVA